MYFKNDFFESASYHRLHAVASVLERFVASAPRALCSEQLCIELELSAPEIRKICSSLRGIGLIAAAEDGDHWILVGEPGDITLEDVWRSVMGQKNAARKTESMNAARVPADEIDLLIGQALIAINKSISTQLRRCQLDRIKASQCGFCVAFD